MIKHTKFTVGRLDRGMGRYSYAVMEYQDENGYVPIVENIPEDKAAFIVRAANSHDALVEALRVAERYIHFCGANETEKGRPHPQQMLVEQIEAALKLAEAE